VIDMRDDGKVTDILHLRLGVAWANQRLYRSAVVSEGLMQFFQVQPAVTNQLAAQQQYRDFVAVAGSRGGICVDVRDLDSDCGHLGNCVEFAQHLFAEAATGA
jgi:hypothetical protein